MQLRSTNRRLKAIVSDNRTQLFPFVAAATFVFFTQPAAGQDFYPATMPDGMKFQNTPFPGSAAQAPNAVPVPEPVIYDVGSGPQKSSSTAAPALTQQQFEYLKNNAVSLQQTNNPTQSVQQQDSSIKSPQFISSPVTGFAAQQSTDVFFLPQTKGLTTQSSSHTDNGSSSFDIVSRQALEIYNSNPARILLDSAKAAGGALAPPTPIISMLNGAAMTSDVLQAQQSGGSFAANEKVFEKTFVMTGQTLGTPFGPIGAALGAGVAQGSYSIGKAIQPWLDSKLNISEAILAIDQKYGISNDARALEISKQEIERLRQQIDIEKAKISLNSVAVTGPNIASTKQASTTATKPSLPTSSQPNSPPKQSPTISTPPAANLSASYQNATAVAPALTNQPMTATQALEAGINLKNLRPLTDFEAIQAIGNGVDPKNVKNLWVMQDTKSTASSVPAPPINSAPVNQPYLGAGQKALDDAFSSGTAKGGLEKPPTSLVAPSPPSNLIHGSSNAAMLSPSLANSTSPPTYTFKQTPYGTVETFENGQRIATTTPEYAMQKYGYNPTGATTAKTNLSGFGVTKQDVYLVTKAPAIEIASPSKTEYSNAPGKPKDAIAPQLKPKPATSRSTGYNGAPRNQQYRQRGPDCQQLHAMAVQRLMMGDISACYQLQAVCPAYVARCG